MLIRRSTIAMAPVRVGNFLFRALLLSCRWFTVFSLSREHYYKFCSNLSIFTRRQAVGLVTTLVSLAAPSLADSEFQTKAVGRSEYTNSITASRDTNISPQEAYDVILEQIPPTENGVALDLGAGAGLSTCVLYNLGYKTIDAVDWSRDAWDANTDQPQPYTAGTWGPTGSVALIERDGRTWHEESEY